MVGVCLQEQPTVAPFNIPTAVPLKVDAIMHALYFGQVLRLVYGHRRCSIEYRRSFPSEKQSPSGVSEGSDRP